MKRLTEIISLFCISLLLFFVFTLPVEAQISQAVYDVIEELDVKTTMRDGVRLSTNIYRPDTEGKFPVLLMRTPYGNGGSGHRQGYFFAERGYAVVIQDCRGRYESEGVFDPMQAERIDGYDTQQWIGSQSWCNGKIGTFGASYVGFTQWISAPLQSDYLVTMVPVVTVADFYNTAYYGGAFRLRMWTSWGYMMSAPYNFNPGRIGKEIDTINKSLPLIEQDRNLGWKVTFLHDWLLHPEPDKYWDKIRIKDGYKKIKASAFNIGSWFDICLSGTLENFVKMTSPDIKPEIRAKQKLLIGPWTHRVTRDGKVGTLDFGKDAIVNMQDVQLKWFDSNLRGIDTGIVNEPPVKIFVMGENVWRYENEWPLTRADYQKYYLSSGGYANSLKGDGVLSLQIPEYTQQDTFTYNPENPVPSTADGSSFRPMAHGPTDHRPIEKRNDVLVYSTPPLTDDIEVTGPVKVILYAASSSINTDFTAKLLDVFPDGRAMYLCDGIIRASFRNPGEPLSNIKPDKIYKYNIDLWATSNVFKKGHRIRVEISSSNFPRFDRNLNTGKFFATDTTCVKAKQTIYHTREYPSCIILPVIE